MPVANARYSYQQSPWDSPLSFGVQAFIEYNGYIINDRHQADRIRVYNITGLDDSDISDSREVVPGDIGEFVYDSWPRGRTFVITGAIEAGSLGTLKRMERDLKAAYGTLSESPMTFHWFDVCDGFDDQNTLQNYTAVVGYNLTNSLYVNGGMLRWNVPIGTIYLLRSADNRLWGDHQITLRFVYGMPADNTVISLLSSFQDTNNYARITFNNASSPEITVRTETGGIDNRLSAAAVTGLVQGQSLWLRGKREGDLLTAELWKSPPVDNAFPDFSTSVWLTGSDSDNFGDQFMSQVGFGATTFNTFWAFDDFRVESLCPCDVTFWVKKMPNGMSIKDSQDSMNRFKRAFQITMRASKPYAKCATQSRSQILIPSAGSTTKLGFGAPLTAPLTARTFIPGTVNLENDILFINNRGTTPDRPRIVVYGAINNFLIANLTNGQQINWTGNLTAGDYLVFDCSTRTLVNSSGVNMKSSLIISDSSWMQLEPGWNDLYIVGSGYSAQTQMTVFFRGSW